MISDHRWVILKLKILSTPPSLLFDVMGCSSKDYATISEWYPTSSPGVFVYHKQRRRRRQGHFSAYCRFRMHSRKRRVIPSPSSKIPITRDLLHRLDAADVEISLRPTSGSGLSLTILRCCFCGYTFSLNINRP